MLCGLLVRVNCLTIICLALISCCVFLSTARDNRSHYFKYCVYLLNISTYFLEFSLQQQAITLPQSGVFQFDSTDELFCYRRDICIMDVTRFETQVTTQHQIDETYEYYFLEHAFR